MSFSFSRPRFGQIHRTTFIKGGTPQQRQAQLCQIVKDTPGMGTTVSYSEYPGIGGSGIVVFDAGHTDDLKGMSVGWIKKSAEAVGDVFDLSDAAKSHAKHGKGDAEKARHSLDTIDMAQMGHDNSGHWQETDPLIPEKEIRQPTAGKTWEPREKRRWF